jgi:hypothetical protein
MNDHRTPAPAPTSNGQVSPKATPPADAAADGASQPRWDRHPVNIRVTIPFLFRSYYLTIVAGPERRSLERRIIERRKHPLFVLGNVVFLIVFGSVVGLAIMVLLQWLALTFDSGGVPGIPG